MLFDMGLGELFAIGVVGLIIFGPDRLPRVAAQAARFLRQFKEQISTAKASIVEAADIDPSTLKDLRDLDPRNALRDVASPLNDVRRAANDALRVDAPKPKRPSFEAPAVPLVAETHDDPTPQATLDHRDII